MSSSAYQYEGTLAPSHIRLIKLLSKDSSEALQCTIEVVRLDDGISYEALSYVWGGDERKETLEVLSPNQTARTQLSITSNLAIALQQVRYLERTLWVDSICINQEDIQERNDQVKIMSQIYRQAQQVLVSLGQGEDGNPEASDINAWLCLEMLCSAEQSLVLQQRYDLAGLMRLLTSSSGQSEQYSIFPVFEAFVRPADDDKRNKPIDVSEHMDIPSLSSPEFKSLEVLFQNPWFRRAWTWQESFLAKAKIYHYGFGLWGENTFHKAYKVLDMLWKLSRNDDYRFLGLLEASAMLIANEGVLKRSDHSRATEFLIVLGTRRGSGCKYPADLVYSLLGCTTRRPKIEIDYHVPFTSVFIETAKGLIDEYGDLTLFGYIDGGRPPTSSLPSWVPDWREKIPTAGMCSINDFTSFKYNTTKDLATKAELLSDQRTLAVEGIVIDTVVAVQSSQKIQPLKFFAEQFGEHDPYEATDELLQVAVYRTIYRDYNMFEPAKPLRRWDDGAWHRLVKISEGADQSEEERRRVEDALNTETCINLDKLFFKTQGGRIGVGCNMVQTGDTIALLFGAQYPMLLRSCGSNRNYTVVGEAYVHGLMDGEGIDQAERLTVGNADQGIATSREIQDTPIFTPVRQIFHLM